MGLILFCTDVLVVGVQAGLERESPKSLGVIEASGNAVSEE